MYHLQILVGVLASLVIVQLVVERLPFISHDIAPVILPGIAVRGIDPTALMAGIGDTFAVSITAVPIPVIVVFIRTAVPSQVQRGHTPAHPLTDCAKTAMAAAT